MKFATALNIRHITYLIWQILFHVCCTVHTIMAVQSCCNIEHTHTDGHTMKLHPGNKDHRFYPPSLFVLFIAPGYLFISR